MWNSKTGIVVLVVVIAGTFVSSSYIFGLLADNTNRSDVETDEILDVYADAECTKKLTTIDWGILTPSSTKTQTVYIKNRGTTSTSMTIDTMDWVPDQAASYISFSAFTAYNDAYTEAIGYWNFDEGTGTQTYDASGFEHTGHIVNGEWVPGIFNAALNFTGNSVVKVDHQPNLDLTTGITLTAWINPSRIENWMRIIAKSHTTNSPPYTMYGLMFDDQNHLRMEIAVDSQQNALNGQTQINEDAWIHVAGTYDGMKMRLYLDGVLDASSSLIGSIDSNTMPITIGASGFTNDYFYGIIDEVRIYNRALKEIEIQELTIEPPNLPPQDNPLSDNYLTGTLIFPNQVVQVTFTLTVSSEVSEIEHFRFTIKITGTSQE